MTDRAEQLKNDIKELKKLESSASRPHVKDILTIEIRKLETEVIKLVECTEEEVATEAINTSIKSSPAAKCYDVKVTNYAWDQSDKFVKLFLTIKNVQLLDKEQVNCKFESKSVELVASALENKNYIFTIKGLLNNIDPATSYWKIKTDCVVIFLAKLKQGTKWSHLTSNEVKPKPEFGIDDLDANGDPSTKLMSMFKKIYDDGDDEMKRTIAKAWTESREKQNMDF